MALRHVLLLSLLALARAGDFTRYANPLLATRGGGGFGGWGSQARNPGAMSPHPLLRLGPDTTRVDPVLGEVWSKLARHAGYFGSDTHIRAFSHTHVQGAGDADLGNLGIMLSRADAAGVARAVGVRPIVLPFPPLTLDRSPWASPFSHGDEVASPGYYRVGLPALGASAELAASGPRSGMHRYSCAALSNGTSALPCTLILDVCHRAHDKSCGKGSSFTLSADVAASAVLIEGVVVDEGEFVRFNYSGLPIYFTARVEATAGGALVAPSAMGTWSAYAATPAAGVSANASVGADGDSLGAYLIFAGGSALGVTVRVGLSAVSLEGARANLAAEQADGGGGLRSFEGIAAAMDAEWDAALGALRVTQPADAAAGASDAGALAAGPAGVPLPPRAPAEEAAAGAALEAFLASPQGAAVALVEGWARPPEGLLLRLAAARAARDAPGARPGAAEALLAGGLPVPELDLRAAAAALRAGAAAAAARAAPLAGSAAGADLDTLYTLLYISLCAPTTYSDADGAYRGFDGGVHAPEAPGARFMSDLSLWDTYRSQAMLLALLAPRALADEAASLLAMTRQGAMGMPRWPFANLYTEDMQGRHGLPLLADCLVTSGACAGRVSLAEAAAAAVTAANAQAALLPRYAPAGGYADWPASPASLTAEYSIDDFAASLLAAAAGDAPAAAALRARSSNWRSVWDASLPTMVPRLANGSFVVDAAIYNPHPFNGYYTEGNAVQWMWAVPQDMPGLVSAFPGGASQYAALLSGVLANQTAWTSVLSTFLPNPWAWLGNEPSMLLPWAHAWAGAAHAPEAAYWPRWHLRTYYQPSMDMIPGNDDYGALSSWGVFAALGLYPVSPTGAFALGSPIFAEARIAAPLGPYSGAPPSALRILAHNASASRIYVAGARANGVPLGAPLVTWAQLWPQGSAQEALLEFDMTDQPTPWGEEHGRG